MAHKNMESNKKSNLKHDKIKLKKRKIKDINSDIEINKNDNKSNNEKKVKNKKFSDNSFNSIKDISKEPDKLKKKKKRNIGDIEAKDNCSMKNKRKKNDLSNSNEKEENLLNISSEKYKLKKKKIKEPNYNVEINDYFNKKKKKRKQDVFSNSIERENKSCSEDIIENNTEKSIKNWTIKNSHRYISNINNSLEVPTNLFDEDDTKSHGKNISNSAKKNLIESNRTPDVPRKSFNHDNKSSKVSLLNPPYLQQNSSKKPMTNSYHEYDNKSHGICISNSVKKNLIESNLRPDVPRKSFNHDNKYNNNPRYLQQNSPKKPMTNSYREYNNKYNTFTHNKRWENNYEFTNELTSNSKGRNYTLSIAIPASILEETCLLHELRTYVIGQLARSACIYSVDEIIIYNDKCWRNSDNINQINDYIGMMEMILQYQECPQYLRKIYFPKHHYMRKAGVLNALNAPHHLLSNDWCEYREGIVLDKQYGKVSCADVGLWNPVELDKKLESGVRVTVKFAPETKNMKRLYGSVVSSEEPRLKAGLYWGYTVRIANSLAEVFTSERFKEGYDLIIGTSDKGQSVYDVNLKSYSHSLIVFGGVNGLEEAMKSDENIKEDDPTKLFTYYLNTCPDQQSRTIRTEEAVLITLANLSAKLNNACAMKDL